MTADFELEASVMPDAHERDALASRLVQRGRVGRAERWGSISPEGCMAHARVGQMRRGEEWDAEGEHACRVKAERQGAVTGVMRERRLCMHVRLVGQDGDGDAVHERVRGVRVRQWA